MLEKYNKTLTFYGLSLFIPWTFWFALAYLSHRPNQSFGLLGWQQFLAITGLLSPCVVAGYFFWKDKTLKKDLAQRLLGLRELNKSYLALAFLLLPVSIVVAQCISLLFGYDLHQFYISGKPTFTSFLLSPWFILLFAPLAEELAWHSYGMDALRAKFNLFNTCLIFAFYWVFWHLPLSFVQGYYHSNIVAEGWIYFLNFVVSIFVFVILMNWLYYKTNRNIFITVVFHLMANVSNEIFATHPDSKIIQTGLLLLIVIFVLKKDGKMFFAYRKGVLVT